MPGKKDKVLKELKEQLQKAILMEHSTIPPYLYAFWSIKDHTSHVAQSIFEVVKEEMLHMALGCNILNSIGGQTLLRSDFKLEYPTGLPAHDQLHDPFLVHLHKCGKKAIVTFLHIELPESLGLLPDADPEVGTIGEFYEGIIENINKLDDSDFSGERQILDEFAPSGSGILFSIDSKEKALQAIEEIIEQGEGLSLASTHMDSSKNHFNRFLTIYREMGGLGEITKGKFNGMELVRKVDPVIYEKWLQKVTNVVSNPHKNNSQSSDAKFFNNRFNSEYSAMLDALQFAVKSKEPSIFYSIEKMFRMTRHVKEIMSIPVDPDDLSKGYCGPTFDYIPPHERN